MRHPSVAALVDGVVIRSHLESRIIISPSSTSSIWEK
ncbi:protein of unknown function [Cyanobium sp. NIES-981]|nr:protein of unknown function [Cyanobium sp. NIES-981]